MILVTGATGFLGQRLCLALGQAGIAYQATSRSLGVDLCNEEKTKEYFCQTRPEIVMNCASFLGGVQFGYTYPADMFYNNMKMELSILEACRVADVKRLINPIGNCSYPGNATYFREEEFWDGPLHPSVMAYGLAKKAMCVGAWAYGKQHGMDIINLVFSNMYGPNDHFDEERSHAVGALIQKIVKAKDENAPTVTIWGTGKPIREWLYVDDAVQAMILALKMDAYADIINIGVAKGYTIAETAEFIKKIVGYQGNFVFDISKIDGAECKIVDGSRCQKILNWHPETQFYQGLEQTVDWYVKNKHLFV